MAEAFGAMAVPTRAAKATASTQTKPFGGIAEDGSPAHVLRPGRDRSPPPGCDLGAYWLPNVSSVRSSRRPRSGEKKIS
jgi:hypothetical protein